MHVEQQDQSIFFNGLSGSGKSSSRKLVVNHLIAISPKKQKVSKVLSSIEKMESVLEGISY